MKHAYQELVRFLRGRGGTAPMIRFRGDDERAYLAGFTRSVPKPAAGNNAPRKKTVREEIRDCSLCSNVYDRKAPYGNGENGIMVILHAPRMLTAAEKKQYRLESAELLRKMLGSIDVDIEECYITSLIKCETEDTLNKPSGMFGNCERILRRELEEARPRLAIVMGDIIPLKRIIDRNADIPWFTVDHPIALLKNPGLKKKAWTTLKLVRDKLQTPPAP